MSTLALTSCGKEKVPPGGKVNSVSVSQSSIEVQLGKRSSDITVSLEGAGEYNKNVKLVSENEAIAKASFTEVESGDTFKVYGIAAGTTKINVVSIQDETKATSLSVQVKAKEEMPEPHEVLSVSMDRETKLFHISDEAIGVKVSINGRGPYDKTGTISLSDNPCVTVDKTSVTDGDTITITPKSLSAGEEKTVITLASVEDPEKIAELSVRVIEDEVIPQVDVISLNCAARRLQEGGESFEVAATTDSDTVEWSWKEEDASTYVAFDGTPTKDGAKVKGIKATPDGVVATLVAKVGTAKAECRFTVAEREKDTRTFYVSNNSFLGYEKVYLYAWTGDETSKVENAEFPGVELTEKIQNTLGEDCYKFTVDILQYEQFIISDGSKQEGHQTIDCSFGWFGANNNVWFDSEGAHFTQIAKDEPTVSFFTNSVSLYTDDGWVTYGFEVRKGNAEYEVTNGSDRIEVKDFANGSISVKGKAVGNATIRVYIPNSDPTVTEPLAEDFLYVEVLDASMAKSFYFTNVNALHWAKVYAYMWKEGSTDVTPTNWPGIELTNPLKNNGNEDVYLVHVPNKYDHVVINDGGNGSQTQNIDVNDVGFNTYNNIYCSGDPTDGKYGYNFANFEEKTYTVAFATSSVTVYNGKNVRVSVNANDSGVTYNVVEGSDTVQLFETADNHIILKWLKAGSAKVKATLHGVSAELNVTCSSETAPDTKTTYYFSNNYGWGEVYLYMWGSASSAGDWPGTKLTDPLCNTSYQDVYVIEIDTGLYDKFIVNNGGDAKTIDISVDNPSFASNNNIYLDGDPVEGAYNIGFATFEEHTHTYNPTSHYCTDPLCGRHDPAYVKVTFKVNYNTGGDGDLYIVFIHDPNPQEWVKMTWSDGNNWFVNILYAPGTHLKFKAVVGGRSGDDIWEGGSDREWDVPDYDCDYVCNWQA